MNLYRITIDDWEESSYRLFISEKKLSEKQFEKLAKIVLKIAAERTFEDKMKEKKKIGFISWYEIMDNTPEVMREKGFIHINPVSYNTIKFICIAGDLFGGERDNDKFYNTGIFKKISNYNKKIHDGVIKRVKERKKKDNL